MKIDPVKWLRRQAFHGEPVTLENTLKLVLGKLGYSSFEGIVLALMTGETTAAKLKKMLDEQARETLKVELLKSLEKLQEQVAKL